MNIPPPPDLPDVRFRNVPKHSQYLVSDDGKVWRARPNHWREMKTHKGPDGRAVVWLMNDLSVGGEDVVVEDLVKKLFGDN